MDLDALRDRLTQHARPETDTGMGWELHAFATFARIDASTPVDYPTASEAYDAAERLCAALLADDLALIHEARIGATGGEGTQRPESWRGWVQIGVEDAAGA